MPNQKPVTKSFMLNSVDDADILEYLAWPQISISAAVREGLRLLIHQEEGVQVFEAKAIGLLEQIVSALSGGVVLPKAAPAADKYEDPFLDSSL